MAFGLDQLSGTVGKQPQNRDYDPDPVVTTRVKKV